jgi:hypothetical protein
MPGSASLTGVISHAQRRRLYRGPWQRRMAYWAVRVVAFIACAPLHYASLAFVAVVDWASAAVRRLEAWAYPGLDRYWSVPGGEDQREPDQHVGSLGLEHPDQDTGDGSGAFPGS